MDDCGQTAAKALRRFRGFFRCGVAAKGVEQAKRGLREANKRLEEASRGVEKASKGRREAKRRLEEASRGLKEASKGVKEAKSGGVCQSSITIGRMFPNCVNPVLPPASEKPNICRKYQASPPASEKPNICRKYQASPPASEKPNICRR